MNLSDMDKMLSIGSIVKLRKMSSLIMVAGYFPKNIEKDIRFDYFGVFYPFGYVTPESNIIFQSDAIEEIVFNGYTDVKREEMVKEISSNKELQKRMLDFPMKEGKENE